MTPPIKVAAPRSATPKSRDSSKDPVRTPRSRSISPYRRSKTPSPPKISYNCEFDQRMRGLRKYLELEPLSCEAKWTLFVAAAFNFRWRDRLTPFPRFFLNENDGERNIEKLQNVINDCPRLPTVLQELHGSNSVGVECSKDVKELLHWALVDMCLPRLRCLSLDELQALLCRMGQSLGLQRPKYVFQVLSEGSVGSERRLLSRDGSVKDNLGFFGGPVDLFYSIMTKGFAHHQHMESSYNCPPIRLYKDPLKAFEKSPLCATWGKSRCGATIACIALCEYDEVSSLVKPLKDSEGKVIAVSVQDGTLIGLRALVFFDAIRVAPPPQEDTQIDYVELLRGLFPWILSGLVLLVLLLFSFRA